MKSVFSIYSRDLDNLTIGACLSVCLLHVHLKYRLLIDPISINLIVYLLTQLHDGVKKSGIMGFCDPCPGEPKQLHVEYTYRGDRYEVLRLVLIVQTQNYLDKC